jgi:hypothetical protein
MQVNNDIQLIGNSLDGNQTINYINIHLLADEIKEMTEFLGDNLESIELYDKSNRTAITLLESEK